ncbi:MAG: 2,3-bisphosphoglycerate-independent phosphoglycerate mutase [Syntrophomonadaceae bacterium]|jgi:2,3-bisphosphoglycerate-independent phosphoglycerate mutase|nr:2,3-bisphosphoglycerate-independent phosphoglycerate mutase [Syntrophomonadaceae bacterium]
MVPRPLTLVILDGWGDKELCDKNAIALADPPVFKALKRDYPYTVLEASGLEVGLPQDQMGNSEVGHLNIGAGRVVYQEITRISREIHEGSFFENRELKKAMEYAGAHQGALHLMGLVSDGGVHSHLEHIIALLEMAHRQGLTRVYLHAFLDGRDVPPASALEYIEVLEDTMLRLGTGKVATVMGRYYAMDRDKRWERNRLAFEAMVLGRGKLVRSAREAIENSYRENITDEFVEPAVVVDESGTPLGLVQDGDGVIFFNFRADRARQITRALVDRDFKGFHRVRRPEIYYVCFTQYDVNIKAPVAFLPQSLKNTLGEYLSQQGLRQLRIAETEKYAHVTFFFNGGREQPYINEDRILIPSPQVATYDLQPEMSAYKVTERVIEEIKKGIYDVVIMNYANPDMVGHTGNLKATIAAVKAVDECMGQVVDAVLYAGGVAIVTADHGNAETMVDEESCQPCTAHTTNKVPFILVGDAFRGRRLREGGSLRDIAPTMLSILGLPIPDEMTGVNLIVD